MFISHFLIQLCTLYVWQPINSKHYLCWQQNVEDIIVESKIFFQAKECFDYLDPNGFCTPLLWSAREGSHLSWSTVAVRGDVGRQKPWKGLLSQHQNFCFGEEVFWLDFQLCRMISILFHNLYIVLFFGFLFLTFTMLNIGFVFHCHQLSSLIDWLYD